MQASRQGGGAVVAPLSSPSGIPSSTQVDYSQDGFVVNSSGSIGYQNQRLFGVRRLRFGTDLRLNGPSLFPIYGDSRGDEVAVWESRIDYSIGRTQLRMNFMLSSVDSNRDLTGQPNEADKTIRINKSLTFSIFRSFGDL